MSVATIFLKTQTNAARADFPIINGVRRKVLTQVLFITWSANYEKPAIRFQIRKVKSPECLLGRKLLNMKLSIKESNSLQVLEKEIAGTKGIFKEKQRKELQEQADVNKQIDFFYLFSG